MRTAWLGRRRFSPAVARRPAAALFVVAFAVRLIPQMINGAMTGDYGYDPAVYYAAADSFLHGRMPYRDFILLHPPGIMLADAPFAWLGALTSDRAGFAALAIFFALLSATSAVLVTRVAHGLGMPRRAALIAGIVYALWFGSLIAEYEPRLEPLGSFLVVCGLRAALAARTENRSRRAAALALVAGACFGAAMSVKIWWAVPVLVVVVGELFVARPWRRVALLLAGIGAAVLSIDGPFLLVARSKMWSMVVLDQLGRPSDTPNALTRPAYLSIGWPSIGSGETRLRLDVAFGAACLVVLACRAWRVRAARVIVVMLLAQLALIVVEPTWFPFYADFLTVGLSLVAGAACTRRDATASSATARTRDASPWVAAAIAAGLATAIAWSVPENTLVTGVPAARLAAAARGDRCVMTDSPMALIDMDRLTTQLRRGCPNLVDVTGLIFVLDRRDHRRGVLRTWNTDMISYLRSGDAVLIFRPPRALSLTYATTRLIERDGEPSRVGTLTLYRLPAAHAPRHLASR